MATDYYVRTMVVIYGNQAGGKLTSKPGMSTFKKHVRGYGPSTAKTKYDLPDGFKPEDEYTMVRCTFYIFNKYVEGTSPETIRQTFLEEQLQKAHGELGKILWNKAVIELPNGDDFFRKPKQGKEIKDTENKNLEKETIP